MTCTAFPSVWDRRWQLNPGCAVASISDRLPHFVIGTNVTTYFPHRKLLYRGFVTGLLHSANSVLTYRYHVPVFTYPLTSSVFPIMQLKVA
ncbi:hypothetical protein [Anditalea andensis]|uniref:hypothetical protein n=1 Tax=Anditalea andensis TaxID=1048983 RepID=UPI0013DEFE68|nr:hypothetical protein [Anditalea andensis]